MRMGTSSSCEEQAVSENTTTKRFLLRLEPELYAIVEKWAADDLRSVNAQIMYLLKEAARRSGRWKGEKVEGEELQGRS